MGNWASVGVSTPADMIALCRAVTQTVDNITAKNLFTGINKPYVLRASTNTEYAVTSERERVMIDKNQNLSFIVQFRPIIQVLGMTYQGVPGNGLNTTQNVIPINADDLYFEGRMIVAFGFGIGSIPSSTGWGYGYLGDFGSSPLRVSVTYINGFPNTQLIASANSGDTQIQVDDPTGIMPGDNVTIYDTDPEDIVVNQLYVPGSPTVLLANSLMNNHSSGVRVSELGDDLRLACVWLAMHIVQSRGQSGTTPTRKTLGTGAVPMGSSNFYEMALDLLDQYILTP